MAGKVVLGFLSKRICFSSVQEMNVWGLFSRCSYSTAQKTGKIAQQATLTEFECKMHNSKAPTYKQVKKSPELQKRLAEMYESYAKDPDFHQLTIESMKVGIRTLGKEKR